MNKKSECDLRKIIRHKLEDVFYIASLIGGYDGEFDLHSWGKETVTFIEETESEILRKMKYRPPQHPI